MGAPRGTRNGDPLRFVFCQSIREKGIRHLNDSRFSGAASAFLQVPPCLASSPRSHFGYQVLGGTFEM